MLARRKRPMGYHLWRPCVTERDRNEHVDQTRRDHDADAAASPRGSTQDETDSRQNKQIQALDRKVVWAWVFGPGIAVIAVLFTGLQWKTSAEQLKLAEEQLADAKRAATGADASLAEQREIAKRQARASEDAAAAMERSAAASEASAHSSSRLAESGQASLLATQRSIRLDQRAWIGLKGIRDLRIEVGKPPSGTLVFVNTGKTPALEAAVSSYVEYVPPGATPRPEAPGDSIDEVSLTVIHPNQESWSVLRGSYLTWTDEMSDAVALRTGNLYVRARITYVDIFGVRHETRYCGVVARDLGSVGACGTGNTAD